jgi:3-hydroxybutyryl-CoA dehydratase
MDIQHLQVGDTLSPIIKNVTLEKMSQPLMALKNPLHYDQAFSVRNGLRAPIAAGMMSCAYLSEMLAKTFGTAWLNGSQFKTTFIQPVFVGDTVTAKGVVRTVESTAQGNTVTVDVWCENQRGEKVTVGEAVITFQ